MCAGARKCGGGMVVRWVRLVTLVLVVCGAALAALVLPALGGSSASRAYACGLGNTPTMLADNMPSLLFPVNKDTPPNVPIGIFATNYVAGQSVAFVEDLSRVQSAPTLDSFRWRWTFGDATSSTDISPKHAYAAAGDYDVHAQIFDTTSNLWTDLDSARIHVIAAPLANAPIVKATSTSTAVALGGTITFDAAGSRALVGAKLSYQWNFNDGTTATDPHVTHTFAIPGSGVVALIATDARGARSVALINILVAQDLASLDVSANVVATGATVTFDASRAISPSLLADGTGAQYTWNFGDGTPPITTLTPAVSHTFTRAGRYSVTVQAVDKQGTLLAATAVLGVGNFGGASDTGPNWWVLGGGGVALAGILVAAYLAIQAQRRRNALIRQREAALELARARPVRQAGQSRQGGRPNSAAPRRPRSY